MAVDEFDPRLTGYRISRLEKDVEKFENIPGRVKVLEDGFAEIKTELKRNTRALITLALSIAGSAVAFALAVLTATGKL